MVFSWSPPGPHVMLGLCSVADQLGRGTVYAFGAHWAQVSTHKSVEKALDTDSLVLDVKLMWEPLTTTYALEYCLE